MYRYFLLCFFLGACKNDGKKTPDDTTIDSIRNAIINRSNAYQFADNMDSLGYFLDSMENVVEKIHDDDVKLIWLSSKIQQVRRQEKKDSQSYYMNIALNHSKSPGISKRKLLNFYIVFGNEILGKSRDSALKIGIEAYHLAIQLDSFRYAETCFDLAEIYDRVNDQVNVRKYLFEAWRYRQQEQELIPYIAKRIAGYYDLLDQTDSAIHFLNIIVADSSLLWNSELRSEGYENKAYLLSRKGEHQDALANLFKAKKLNDQLDRNNFDVFTELSQVFSELKQYVKANEYADSALIVARQKMDYPLIKNAWKLKSSLFAERGLYEKAYAALDSAFTSYTIEMDSAFRVTARDLETKYAVREKDAAIKALETTNVASLKIRDQQRIIIVTIIVIAILALIAGVLLWMRHQARIEIREADLRQQILRAHIKPHFLFNMLSLLQGLIRTNDQEKSILLLNKLSRLLRGILENFRKKFVPLSDEIAVLESYLTLQEMYMDGKFEYNIEVDTSIEQDAVQIPPMLLQPFAENAIQHGFHNLQRKGALLIRITRVNGSLACLIDDNGKGMQPSTKDGRFHASEMTEERLAILSKQTHKQTKLKLTDKASVNAGEGVRVEIEIPFVNTTQQ